MFQNKKSAFKIHSVALKLYSLCLHTWLKFLNSYTDYKYALRYMCVFVKLKAESKLNCSVSVGSLQEMKIMNIHYIMSLHNMFTLAWLPPTLRAAGAYSRFLVPYSKDYDTSRTFIYYHIHTFVYLYRFSMSVIPTA